MYGREELPRVYGVERGYWYYGRPHAARVVLYVGKEATKRYLSQYFAHVRKLEVTQLDAHPRNINQNVAVWLGTDQRSPWPRLWHQLHRL